MPENTSFDTAQEALPGGPLDNELLVDARFLQPPEPFERTMEALDLLQPGQQVRLLLYREPFPLYKILRQNGYDYRQSLEPDGTFVIRIRPTA